MRSDLAMRRHWALVWGAFSCCWWHLRHGAAEAPDGMGDTETAARDGGEPGEDAGWGEKSADDGHGAAGGLLACGLAQGAGVVGPLAHAVAVVACVDATAPAAGPAGAAHVAAARLPDLPL